MTIENSIINSIVNSIVQGAGYSNNMYHLTANYLTISQVKVLGMLHHPNIIAYYDSFEEDGLLMIEMEYADGGYVQTILCIFFSSVCHI